jgi:glutamate racemase
VLGCTHYPFLTGVLKEVLPENVTIIDPAPAVIMQAQRVLKKSNLINDSLAEPSYEFYTSGDTKVLKSLLDEITNLPCKIIKV